MEALYFSKTCAIFCQTTRSALEKAVAYSFKMLQRFYQTTHHIPQDSIHQCHLLENLSIYVVFPASCCGPDRQHPRKYEIYSIPWLVFAVAVAVGATCKHCSRVFRYDLNPSKIFLFTWQLQFLIFISSFL
jgi:hypothetical protein